jgi:hypothetical protein
MSTDAQKFLKQWHRIAAERDIAAIEDLLAEGVSLGAPPYWTKLQGCRLVNHLLGLILQTIEGFTYHREWADGAELALEFTGRVGDMDVQGIDLISLDDENKVRNVDVMIRPVNAVIALQKIISPKMEAFLTGGAAKG